jgi:serine/threonine protein kinase
MPVEKVSVSTPRSEEQQWLGKYRLDERLGRGGMAEVWKATLVGALGFERPVAIKRILPHLLDEPEFVRMFLAEARLTAQLHHPNIVQILELGHENHEYFLAMELVRGHDLHRVSRWLSQRAPMNPGFGAYVVLEIARALAYAHELKENGKPLGLVHRDVSPSNVMLGMDGAVQLLDFGVAKAVEATSDARTRTGVLKGKLGYFSPEQARGEKPDQRTDQFAAGVVLHELLTGKPLFRRDSDAETMALVMQGASSPPSQINPAVSPALDAICRVALARDPNERFPDCRSLVQALEPIVFELGWSAQKLAALMKELVAETPEAKPSPETSRASTVAPIRRRRRRARNWFLWSAMLAIAIVGGGLVFVSLRSPSIVREEPVLLALPDLSHTPDLAPQPALAPADLAVALDLAHARPAPREKKKAPPAFTPGEPVDPFED